MHTLYLKRVFLTSIGLGNFGSGLITIARLGVILYRMLILSWIDSMIEKLKPWEMIYKIKWELIYKIKHALKD